MRTLFSFLGLLAISFLMLRAQQTLTLTPQTLTGWTVAGADTAALSAETKLSLPAGAQLARSFRTEDLAVLLTTKPTIGESPADWPVLELGSAALVFTRTASTGKLVLISDQSSPLELPFTFTLDPAGQTTEELTLEFERSGAVISVGDSSQTLQFPSAKTAINSVEIVISAGAAYAWSFQRFELAVGATDAQVEGANRSSASSPSDDGNGAVDGRTKRSASLTVGDAMQATAPVNAGDGHETAVGTGNSTRLEIYTPPAVRLGRVESARASAAQMQNQ